MITRGAVVIGGGKMGSDIARQFLRGRWNVQIVEAVAEQRGTLEALRSEVAEGDDTSTNGSSLRLLADVSEVDWLGVEIAIEAIRENLLDKQALFKKLDVTCPTDVVIGSNTSGLRVSEIAKDLPSAGRMLGLHFFMPAHLVPAVEVVKGIDTTLSSMDKACTIMEGIGKKPIRVMKDAPGFLINRIQHALMREAIALVEEGVATPGDVDDAVRFGFGFRYSVAGPLMQKDISGLDVHLNAARSIYPSLHNNTSPSKYLEKLVADGKLGLKGGSTEGFYQWTGDVETINRSFLQALKDRLPALLGINMGKFCKRVDSE